MMWHNQPLTTIWVVYFLLLKLQAKDRKAQIVYSKESPSVLDVLIAELFVCLPRVNYFDELFFLEQFYFFIFLSLVICPQGWDRTHDQRTTLV